MAPIVTVVSFLAVLSFATAQTGIISAALPSSSGYSSVPSNFTTCPESVDSLCVYTGQTTFCYDASSVLYTVTCGMSFTGGIIEPNTSGEEEEEVKKAKRDSYFALPYVGLADCTAACDGRSSCKATNVVNGTSCELLDTITGISIPSVGVVAAYKGYWGYNSTIPAFNGTIPTLNSTSNGSDPVVNATSSAEVSPVSASTSSAVFIPSASSALPSISANDTMPVVGPTAFSSTTFAGVLPSGIQPSAGFGFSTVVPVGPIGTGLASGVSTAPSGFPSASSFPSCASVKCSLSDTPSTPYCHDQQNQLYTINCGLAFVGETMLTIPHWDASLSGCADACDDVTGCQAVNFDAATEDCTLVSGVTGIDFQEGVVGAWKGYWAQYEADPTASAGFSGTAPHGTAPIGTAPLGTTPIGTAPITASANSTSMPTLVGTVGTSGFPSLSINGSGIAVGPTATGGSFPTGSANPTGSSGDTTYPACPEDACVEEGTAYCTDARGQMYTLNCGIKFTGTIGLNASGESLAECQGTCDSLARCLAFNYGYGQCQFMYTVTGVEFPAYGWTGAWRGLWSGGAPPSAGSTGTSGLPINSANSSSTSPALLSTGSVSVPASATYTPSAGTSGFPSISANRSSAVGPTGFVPSGVFPTGTGSAYPTSYPSNATGNATFGLCASAACSSYGAVYCTDDQKQLYTLNCGIKFKGIVSSTAIASAGVEACADACDLSSSCIAYNFALANSSCSFFEVVTGVDYPAPGYIAAWKGYWAGGAPSAASSGVPGNSANVTFPGTGFISVPLNTGVSAKPTASANSSIAAPVTTSLPLGTATSGFPSISANSSVPIGSTGFFPTGSFPRPTGSSSNTSSCASASCEESQTYCTDSAGQLYTLNCGLKFTGVATNISASSLDACESLCDSQSGCQGVNFNGYQCQVVTIVTGVQYPAPGWIAAWKGIWAGGAPVLPSSAIPVNSANITTPFAVPTGTGSSSATSNSATSNSSVAAAITTTPTTSSVASSGFSVPSSNSTTSSVGTSVPITTGSPTSPNSTYALCSATGCPAQYCTDEAGQLYSTTCGSAFVGTSINTTEAINKRGDATILECEAYCDSVTACVALNYDGSCTYLSAVTGIESKNGSVAIWKGYWGSFSGNDTYGGFPSSNNGSFPSNGTITAQNATSVLTSATSSSPASSSTVFTVSITSASASVPGTSGIPVPSSNSSSYIASPTSVPSNASLPSNSSSSLCSATGDCVAAYQTSFCSDAEGQGYTLTCGMAFEGTLISEIEKRQSSASLLDCEAYCDSESACVALNYDGAACAYLSAVTGIEPKNGSIAVWKGIWAGGAPPHGNASLPLFGNGTFSSSGFPVPSANTTSSSLLTAPVTASATLTASSTSSAASTESASSVTTNLASNTSSIILTTGTPAPAINGSASANATLPSCSSVHCAAPYQQSFCSDESGQTYTVTCGIAFEGAVLPTEDSTTRTLLDCEATCDDESDCIALNFDGSHCTYLSAVTGIEQKNGSVAAWKGVWAGGAPTNGSGYSIPSNSTGSFNGTIPSLPTANATVSSLPIAPITASVTTTASIFSVTSSSDGASSSLDVSSTSSSASSFLSSTSSSIAAPLSTGASSQATSNSSLPTNATVQSCDAPAITDCAAGYGLGSSALCTDGSNQTYTVTCGIEFVGPSLSNTSASSLSMCENQCDASYSCVALNFLDGGKCALVSAIYSVIENPDSIAAYRGVWLGGAPSGNGTYGSNATFPGLPTASVPADITSSSAVSAFPTVSINSTLSSAPPTSTASATSTTVSSLSLTTSSLSISETSYTTYTTTCSENNTLAVHTHSAPITDSTSSSVSVTASLVDTTSSSSASTGSIVSASTSSTPITSVISTSAAPTASSYPLCSLGEDTYCASSNATYCVDDNGQLYTVTCGIALDGTTISDETILKRDVGAATSSLLECEDVCDSQSECIALNFANSTCTLLSSINGTSDVTGSLAAYKGYWSGTFNGTGEGDDTLPSTGTSSAPATVSATSTAVSSTVSTLSAASSESTSSVPSASGTAGTSTTSSVSESTSTANALTGSISSASSSSVASAQAQSTSSAVTSSIPGASIPTGPISSPTTSSSSFPIPSSSKDSGSTSSIDPFAVPPSVSPPSYTSQSIRTSSSTRQTTSTPHSSSHSSTHSSTYSSTRSSAKISTHSSTHSSAHSSTHSPSKTSSVRTSSSNHATTSSHKTSSSAKPSASSHKPSTTSSVKPSVKTASVHKPSTSSSVNHSSTSSARKLSASSTVKPTSSSTHKLSTTSSVKPSSTSETPLVSPTIPAKSSSPPSQSSSSQLMSSSASPVVPPSSEGGSRSSSFPVDPVTASTSSPATSSATPSTSSQATSTTTSSSGSSSPVASVTASTSLVSTSSAALSTSSQATTAIASSSSPAVSPTTAPTSQTFTTSSKPTATPEPTPAPYQPNKPEGPSQGDNGSSEGEQGKIQGFLAQLANMIKEITTLKNEEAAKQKAQPNVGRFGAGRPGW